MLTRCSLILKRSFSKDQIVNRWKRTDPNRYWRAQHKLPRDDEEHGPLTDLPDYSYLSGEPSHLSTVQRKKYDFNASIVHRIHQLDRELTEAKKLYAEKISSTMQEYKSSAEIAKHIETRTSSTKPNSQLLEKKPSSSIAAPNEYSFQPNLLNALRASTKYNEAFKEVVDPVGEIVPTKLMSIERPPYKRTGDRRRYHKIFKIRTPNVRMFPK